MNQIVVRSNITPTHPPTKKISLLNDTLALSFTALVSKIYCTTVYARSELVQDVPEHFQFFGMGAPRFFAELKLLISKSSSTLV